MHGAGNLLNAAKVDAANPVAAMPSLHSAYALIVVAFFLPTVRKRWWPLLLAYPLAMTFTLVYSGEHYVTDVLVGWFYVAVTMVGVCAAEKAWAAWKQRQAASPVALPTPVSPLPTGLSPAPSGFVLRAGDRDAGRFRADHGGGRRPGTRRWIGRCPTRGVVGGRVGRWTGLGRLEPALSERRGVECG